MASPAAPVVAVEQAASRGRPARRRRDPLGVLRRVRRLGRPGALVRGRGGPRRGGPEGYRKTVSTSREGSSRRSASATAARSRPGTCSSCSTTPGPAPNTRRPGRSSWRGWPTARGSRPSRPAPLTAFPEELLALAREDPEAGQLVEAERAALLARRQALAGPGRRARPPGRAGAERPRRARGLASVDRQMALIDEEIATVEGLLAKGLDRKPHLLALRQAGRLRGPAGGDRGQRRPHPGADRRHAPGAPPWSAAAPRRSPPAWPRRAPRSTGSRRRRAPPATSSSGRWSSAPVAGEVVELQLRTLGVVGSSEPILSLVPRDEPW